MGYKSCDDKQYTVFVQSLSVCAPVLKIMLT